MSGINVWEVVAVAVFYLLILAIGIFAAYWSKHRGHDQNCEDVLLAGRDIGLVIGVFTMTATWVGGGYINGTAELVNTPGQGLLWTQAPLCYAASLVVGGYLFADKMRSQGHVTMLDPLQSKFGSRMGALLFLPAVLGEICWSGAALNALGASLSVILGLQRSVSILVSAFIAVLYTLVGGLYSVAFTDVAQLLCIFLGLWVAVPFILTNKAVGSLAASQSTWLGTINPADTGLYVDGVLMLIFGGIPWQVYFQRVLSSRSPSRAKYLSLVAGLCCSVMALPSVLVGAAAASTNWTETTFNRSILDDDRPLTLPLSLKHLCPPVVSVIGLGAISAATMSSCDSSILSAASMFSRNIFKNLLCPNARERTQLWMMRAAILLIGVLATGISIFVPTIYGLWFLCSDLVYCILFPQLLLVIHCYDHVNTYGSLIGFILSLFVRLASGEPLIHLRPLLIYVGYVTNSDPPYQRFPIKTFAMLMSLVTIAPVSWVARKLFEKRFLPKRMDVLRCFTVLDQGRSL